MTGNSVELELEQEADIVCGAELLLGSTKELKAKKIAVMVNPSSLVGEKHLVDALLEADLDLVKIFAPEHGFRGLADAGEKVENELDTKTGLAIVSLYGKHKKPSAEDLKGIDLVIFDLQDVGVRFYTYISSLHYIMEACAEQGVNVMVLDRPNPNGNRVDGNILNMNFSSFVGMHPVPILHGMTIGEYALMINGEHWLANGVQCNLEVIACQNYDHNRFYSLPVRPSPNLSSDLAIQLYPSTCFFEGTVISEGRGTDFPFQVFGAPNIDPKMTTFSFVPKSKEGAKYPKFENQKCFGFNLAEGQNSFSEVKGINLEYLITMYNLYPNQDKFFLENGFFDLLAGGTKLREDIVSGMSAEQIKQTWEEELLEFKAKRKKYLLYTDFE
ncbi:MAG: DUF1343 domain-containing protein [Bacteroidetes bacterium]|nr:DUF1343 domain-containing protein [Bacteroidota bacterium]